VEDGVKIVSIKQYFGRKPINATINPVYDEVAESVDWLNLVRFISSFGCVSRPAGSHQILLAEWLVIAS